MKSKGVPEGFEIALFYAKQAVRASQEARRLAIQAQGFANLSEELEKINRR